VSKLPLTVKRALETVEVVVTEIPMDAASQVSMAPLLMLPKGKSLKTVLPADLYLRLEGAFQAKGFPIEPLSTLKVWTIAAQLVLIDRLLSFVTQKPLDAELYERAQASGLKVAALETPSEQVAAFDGLSQGEQIHILRKTLDQREQVQREGKDPIESLIVTWLSGNEDKMNTAILQDYDAKDAVDSKVMKRVLTDRNEVMAQRIATMLKGSAGRTHMFAIGTAHLVGSPSVVTLLRKKGYSVTRAGLPP
jgi:uncharacterized protein YbaP (TraB family)